MNPFIIVIISIVIFIGNVYFTRWVFQIDEMIENQKEQIKLLKSISEKIQKNTNITFQGQNENNPDSSKFLLDRNVCPVCQNPIHKFDKKCTNCGLVIFE